MTNVGPASPSHQTVGGFDRSGKGWVLALFGVGGAGLGALLPILAGWTARLPWVPFRGPLELLSSFDQTWLTWGRPILGVAAGLTFAAWVILDSPVLDFHDDEIHVRRRGQVERVIQRSKVDAVYRRGSKIVIESASGRKMFEDEVEGDKDVLRDVFLSHGFPWEGARD